MTLRAMEIFITVVQTLNMSKAAEILHIAQPTISQAIKETEHQYNLVLFERIGKKLYLTDEGARMADYVRAILAMHDDMNRSIGYMAKHPAIKLGATLSIGQTLLAPAIQHFEQDYPEVNITVTVENTTRIEELLLESKIDIGFVEGTVKDTSLIVKPLVQDELVVICPAGHPLLKQREIVFEELAKYPLLVREAGSGTRELFQLEIEKRKMPIYIKWTSHSFDSLFSALEAGQGITVASRFIAEKYLKNNNIGWAGIKDLSLARSFSMVYHKDKMLTKNMKMLEDYFKNTDVYYKKQRHRVDNYKIIK